MKAYNDSYSNKGAFRFRLWKHYAAGNLSNYRVSNCLATDQEDSPTIESIGGNLAMSTLAKGGLLPRYMELINAIYRGVHEHPYGGTAFLWLTDLLERLALGTDMQRLYSATIIALFEDTDHGILRGIHNPAVRAHIEVGLIAHKAIAEDALDPISPRLMDRLCKEYAHAASKHNDVRCKMSLDMAALLFSNELYDQERFMEIWLHLSTLIELQAYPQDEEGRQMFSSLLVANMANRAARLLLDVLDDQTTPF